MASRFRRQGTESLHQQPQEGRRRTDLPDVPWDSLQNGNTPTAPFLESLSGKRRMNGKGRRYREERRVDSALAICNADVAQIRNRPLRHVHHRTPLPAP